MCRYATKNYKAHFACFACRKAFKKTPLEDYVQHQGLEVAYRKIVAVFSSPPARRKAEGTLGITLEQIRRRYLTDVSVCPQCGETMVEMGLDFKAPPQKDEQAWAIIAHLYERGFAFFGCGCGGSGLRPPERLNELRVWLDSHVRKSEGEKLLEAIAARAA